VVRHDAKASTTKQNLVVSWNMVLDTYLHKSEEAVVCDVSQIGPGCCMPCFVLHGVYDTGDFQDSSSEESD
jgi:hypothetical protein